jgi:hypothetical protein
MNDLGFRNRTDGFTDNHRDDRPVDRDKNPQKVRPGVRRWWGMRLFAAGAFLLVAGGVVLGAWSHYSPAREIIATAEEERDFVPSVRVATVPKRSDAQSAAISAGPGTGQLEARTGDLGPGPASGQ